MSRDRRGRDPARDVPRGRGGSGGYPDGEPYPAADEYARAGGHARPYDDSGTEGYDSGDGYASPDRYASSGGYPRSGGYAEPDDYAGSDGYAGNDGYARSGPYSPPDGYAAASDYGPGGYAPAGGYGGSDGYSDAGYQENGYAAADDGYAAADDYGSDAYGSASGYSRPDRYPAAQDPYAGSGGYPGQDRYGASDDAQAPDYPQQDGYQAADAYGQDEPYDERAGYPAAGRDPDGRGSDAGQPGEGWDDAPDREGRDRGEGREGFIPGLADDRDQRRGGKRKHRVGRVLAPLLALVMLAVVGGAAYKLYPRFHTSDYSGPGSGSVTVHVQSGDTASSLAPELVQLGVVASTRAFVDAANASKNPTGLEPGYFSLRKHMKASLAYALLLNPASRMQTVVAVPEGLRVTQIVSLLQQKAGKSVPANAYANAIKDTAALGLPPYANGNPEGYLFPATYDLIPGQSPLSVLQAMVARFNQEAQSIDLPAAAQRGFLTQSQVITVASILEAEGSPRYYAQIAEVIYNRLKLGMNLGLDSTVNYALNRFGVSLTQSQLHVNSPYNTVIHPGLPPGPIDSPGDTAIQAALHPAHGDLTYFVTVNLQTGLTLFTNSPTQFAQDVQECQHNHAC